MLLLVYAVVGAPQAGWASPRTLISFAGAAVLLGAFTVIERRSRDPLVRLSIFRSRTLTRANLAAMVLFGSYVSFQFLVTQYLQIMARWSALSTALAFLPAGVLVAVASTRMGPVLDRFGPARVVAVGFACLAAGYAWFLRIGPAPDYPAVILPAVLLIGAAFGLGFASLNIQATAGVADHEQGLASGILQTSFQIGGAIVLAVVTAVIDARGANHVISTQTLTAYRPALDVIAGVAVAGVAIALSGLRASRPRPASRAPCGRPGGRDGRDGEPRRRGRGRLRRAGARAGSRLTRQQALRLTRVPAADVTDVAAGTARCGPIRQDTETGTPASAGAPASSAGLRRVRLATGTRATAVAAMTSNTSQVGTCPHSPSSSR